MIGTLLVAHTFLSLSMSLIMWTSSKRIREMAKSGNQRAKQARIVLIRANKHILSLQVGLFLASLFVGFFTCQLVNSDPVLANVARLVDITPDHYDYVAGLGGALIVVIIAMVGVMLVQISKAVAFSHTEPLLCSLATMILLTSRIFSPATFLFNHFIQRIAKAAKLDMPAERESAISAQEISEIVEISGDAGQIEEDEREMIQGVFGLSGTVVREVMTPRKDVVSVSIDATLDEVVSVFEREKLSRLLVTGKNLDDVKGIILGKDLIPLVGRQSQLRDIRALLRPAHFVSNTRPVDDLLAEFRENAIHFAVVVDEHGGVDGVVTVEDFVEEVVGEIFDEYDTPAEEVGMQEVAPGELLVDGGATLADLKQIHGIDLPEGEYDTIAGFVLHRLGKIPGKGDVVQQDRYKLIVEDIRRHRVTRVRIFVQSLTEMPGEPPAAGNVQEMRKKSDTSDKIAQSVEMPSVRIQGSR